MSAHRPIVQFYADGRGIKNNLLSIKLEIYFDKQVFIPLKRKFTAKQWASIQDRSVNQDIRNGLNKDNLNEIRGRLDAHMKRANDVIDELAANGTAYSAKDVKSKYYTYTGKSVARLGLFSLINELRDQRKEQGRSLSTLESFDNTRKSIENFCVNSKDFNDIKNVKITDVDEVFLKKYEDYMLKEKKALATVGIYNRVLRSVFNYCIEKKLIPQSAYPYSEKKYTIPAPRTVKKALTVDELRHIISLRPSLTIAQRRAIDYLLFSFMSNGMNFIDIALLKVKNINKAQNYFAFLREKSSREKRDPEEILVQLTDVHYLLMKELGAGGIAQEDYVFPILSKEDNDKYTISQKAEAALKKNAKRLKYVLKKYGLRKEISFQFARHTFGSLMNISNIDIQSISEAFGHTSLKTTQNYINSLPSMAPTKISGVLSSVIPVELFNN